MKYSFSDDGHCLRITGRLMFQDHRAFRAASARLLSVRTRAVMIDLSGVEFIDSAGLGMLLIARDEATDAQCRLTMRQPIGQGKRIFEITKFATLVDVESAASDGRAALEHVGKADTRT